MTGEEITFHYRHGVNIVRFAELEAERDAAIARIRELEKMVRHKRKKLGTIASGGVGAFIGNFLGALVWLIYGDAVFAIAGSAFGFAMGVIWDAVSRPAPRQIPYKQTGMPISGGSSGG